MPRGGPRRSKLSLSRPRCLEVLEAAAHYFFFSGLGLGGTEAAGVGGVVAGVGEVAGLSELGVVLAAGVVLAEEAVESFLAPSL